MGKNGKPTPQLKILLQSISILKSSQNTLKQIGLEKLDSETLLEMAIIDRYMLRFVDSTMKLYESHRRGDSATAIVQGSQGTIVVHVLQTVWDIPCDMFRMAVKKVQQRMHNVVCEIDGHIEWDQFPLRGSESSE
ncbi:hypothetical protein TNCV_3248791 [Trichonephila clavipes]|nr:hypothetical protein TNCV_3248791 [Trichonephila clavipes]